jgi:tRNA pseudouridine38-40 synthase
MAQRIRMAVRYDGTGFAGSQVQPGKRTVAGTLKAGLESLLQHPVKLDFASRTDAGVHADCNVCAFNAELPFAAGKLPQLLARSLPLDLAAYSAEETDQSWHPRFDAKRRSYVYRVWNGQFPPVDRMRYVAVVSQDWKLRPMQTASRHLRGTHDFSAFSASGFAPADSHCTIYRATVDVIGSEVILRFTANRFLRHMVVRLVGSLAKVGSGEETPAAFDAMLNSGKRFQFRPAPAKGLTLADVEY